MPTWLNKKLLIRGLMIVPPILFLLYISHSVVTIRGLLSDSTSFHMDYANDLVQDFLSLEMRLDIEHLEDCLILERDCGRTRWTTLEPMGEPLGALALPDGSERSYFLKQSSLASTLNTFFQTNRGLSTLFVERYHDPVYWFQIRDPKGERVYRSGAKPGGDQTATYAMDRSLKGYRLEIIYNSFGPKQLYSVARTKINFGLIFFLFLMVIFSAFLMTRAIHQKLILARQKTFFVSTVSHEFKTPLSIMKLAAETLAAKRFRSPEEEKRFHHMLGNEINRLNHLVHKILSFNKIETGQVLFHNQEVDLKTILQASLEIFQVQALSENVELKVDLCKEPCPVHGDPDLIRHAVDNILDNAFKYRGDSNTIEVSCGRDEREAWIRIEDHGIGIPKEELPHIGKSFYRINDPKLQGVRGSGLGLAISQYILKHSNARLKVDSETRKGSTFTVAFPVLAPAE